jgi:hypothetical protein
MKQINLRTTKLIRKNSNGSWYVMTKLVGGKRWKRMDVFLSSSELREVKLNKIL